MNGKNEDEKPQEKKHMLVGIRRIDDNLSMIEVDERLLRYNDALFELGWFRNVHETSGILDTKKGVIDDFQGPNYDFLKSALHERGLEVTVKI